MLEAARALTTHLRIEPKSQIAKMNSAYIKQQPGVSIKDFVERQVRNCSTRQHNMCVDLLFRFRIAKIC